MEIGTKANKSEIIIVANFLRLYFERNLLQSCNKNDGDGACTHSMILVYYYPTQNLYEWLKCRENCTRNSHFNAVIRYLFFDSFVSLVKVFSLFDQFWREKSRGGNFYAIFGFEEFPIIKDLYIFMNLSSYQILGWNEIVWWVLEKILSIVCSKNL